MKGGSGCWGEGAASHSLSPGLGGSVSAAGSACLFVRVTCLGPAGRVTGSSFLLLSFLGVSNGLGELGPLMEGG